jgi:hypothetical protein
VGADVGRVELHDLPGLREAHLHLPGPVRAAEGDPEPPGVVQERVDGGVHRGRLPRGGRPERWRARAEASSRHGLPELAVGALGLEEGVVLDGVAPGLGAGPHDDCREVGTAQAGLVREHLHEVAEVKHPGRLQRRRVAAAGFSRRPHWGSGGGSSAEGRWRWGRGGTGVDCTRQDSYGPGRSNPPLDLHVDGQSTAGFLLIQGSSLSNFQKIVKNANVISENRNEHHIGIT